MEKRISAHDITRRLIVLAAPLILGNILQQLYNTFDAYVLGHYAGGLEFSAIGVAGSIMNLFLFALAGMCSGAMVLFSQFYGAGDLEAFQKEHATALFAGVLFTAALAAAGLLMLPLILRAMQTPEKLIPYITQYLNIIFPALPFSFLYNLYSGILRSLGNAALSTAALFCAVLLNLLLDILFVRYLGFGITGAAAATALSQLLAAAVCMVFLWKRYPEVWFHKRHLRLENTYLKKTARFAFVTALHQCSIYLGKLLVQGTVNEQGIDMIAAYTATSRIESFANSFGDSGSVATAIVVAQYFGAKEREKVWQAFYSSLRLLMGFGLFISAVLYFCAPPAAGLMLVKADGPAYQNAVGYLRLISLFYTLCFTGNALAGFYEGVGKVNLPFIGAASHLTIRVILSMVFISAWQLPAVAAATGMGWIYVNIFWVLLLKRPGAGRRAGWEEAL